MKRLLLGLSVAAWLSHAVAGGAAQAGDRSGPRSAGPGVADVMLFVGQSNEGSHGTIDFTATAGAPGLTATAPCYETTATLRGATRGSGTLVCSAPSSGTIYAGALVQGGGVPAGQVVSAANNRGSFPGATGTGGAGTYVVTPAATVGSVAAPVTMTIAAGDIGGSGTLMGRCQIWTPASGWATYQPKADSDPQGRKVELAQYGPEGEICRRWTADNPGKTLFMIKAAIGGAHLCDEPAGNDFSPEYGGKGVPSAGYAFLLSEVQAAEAALDTTFGVGAYRIDMIQWGQGEQDSQDDCGFPKAPFSTSTTPIQYQVHLVDLINRFAIPTPVSANFIGSISGQVLTVSFLMSGHIRAYQLVTGPSVAPETYVASQISGVAGGAGRYHLQVYQAVGRTTITATGGASCSKGYVNGDFFNASPVSFRPTSVVKSCVTGGAFGVGQRLSGGALLPGTVITGLDSAGHTADGWYNINVNQTVSAGAMSAGVAGWGAGADTAQFVMFRTFGDADASGVQIAQDYLNDHPGTAALPVRTVLTDDALKDADSPIHYHATWIAELGRRLYSAYLGTCDYHSPTC